MSELLPTLEALLADAQAGRPAALCTVVETRGSTPQAAGATMVVRGDGKTVGTLGGGCVEAEVRKRAFEMLTRGQSGLLDFVLDHDYGWDDGLICGGRMKVGVMPIGNLNGAPSAGAAIEPLTRAVEQARRHEPTAFPICIAHEGKRLQYRVHLEAPPTLFIAGAGHVGHALARLAVDLDFHVVVIDDRADFVSPERFDSRVELIARDIPQALREYPLDAGCYVVIVTRGHQHDEQSLEAVVRRDAAYIGVIGSRRKTRMIFDDLRALGVSAEQLSRVQTPIGLDIGSVTVPEIALSIAAQLVQVRRRRTPKLVEGPVEVPVDSKP